MIIRELLTRFTFLSDDKALDRVDKKLTAIAANSQAAGAQMAAAFDRPRDAAGRFLVKGSEGYRRYMADGGKAVRATRDFQGALDGVKGTVSQVANRLKYMAISFVGGGLGLGAVFKTMADFEQTEVAFDTLIGNVQESRKTLADLQQFAANTPFNFAGVADLSKQLLAMGFGAKELIPIMTSLGNIAAGVGTDKLPRLVLALGQVRTATKLRGSELRQFTEAGVPLVAELAKTLGKPEKAITGLIEAGQVSYQDVERALKAVTSEGGRFNNLMAKQSQTLGGIFSNIVDNIQMLVIQVGKSGLLGEAKTVLNSVLSFMQIYRKQIVEGLATGINIVFKLMKDLASIAKGMWFVFDRLSRVVGGSSKALMLLAQGIAILIGLKMLASLGAFAMGIGKVTLAWLAMGRAAMFAQLASVAVPLAIGAAIVGLLILIEDVYGFFQGRQSVTGLIFGDMKNTGSLFDKILDPMISKIGDFGKRFARAIIDGFANMTPQDIQSMTEAIMKGIEIALKVLSLPVTIGLAIADGIITGLVEGLRARFPKLAEFLGLNEGGAGVKEAQFNAPLGASGFAGGIFGQTPQSLMLSAANAVGLGSGTPTTARPAFVARQTAGSQVQIGTINQTVTVPPATPPEKVKSIIRDDFFDGLGAELRRASPKPVGSR